MYVLLTDKNTYFVEYLLRELVLSSSISEAMVFDDHKTAFLFKQMLKKECELVCSVNTFLGN